MGIFEIKYISIEYNKVIIGINAKGKLVFDHIHFLLNDFEETVEGDIYLIDENLDENYDELTLDFDVLFPLTKKFNQFNDGILKIEKIDGETTNSSYFIIYSLEKWERYNDEIEKVEAYFTDSLEEEINKRLITIEEMDFPLRQYKCLQRAGILTLGDLMDKTLEQMRNVRNLGKIGIRIVIEKMNEYGVTLLDLDEDFDLDELYVDTKKTDNQAKKDLNTTLVIDDIDQIDELDIIYDLNGYDASWLDIELSECNLSYTSNSDNLSAEFKLSYKSNYGNILNDLDFCITTNTGIQYKKRISN